MDDLLFKIKNNMPITSEDAKKEIDKLEPCNTGSKYYNLLNQKNVCCLEEGRYKSTQK